MARNNEHEIKIMLCEHDYIKLLNISQGYVKEKVLQTNYYFDTSNLALSNNKITLRVREIGNNYKLTLKIKDKTKTNNKLTVSDEYDFTISKDVFCNIIANEYDILKEMPEVFEIIALWVNKTDEISYIGKLMTERIKYKPIRELQQLELDKNLYLGFVDYELEWETKNFSDIRIIEKWLKELDVQFDNNNSSKYGRFIKCYCKLNNRG